MKSIAIKWLCLGVLCFILHSCLQEDERSKMPQPIESTIVKMDMEEGHKKKDRMAWFDLMHKTDEGVEWRDIHHKNMLDNYRLKLDLRDQATTRNDEELVADGKLLGKWSERGASNIAGNLRITQYDAQSKELFAISDGGTLWRGNITGLGWQVVNQDIRFSPNLLEVVYNEEGQRIIFASIRNQPAYSMDEGATWEFLNLPTQNGSRLYHTVNFTNPETGHKEVIFLHRRAWSQNITVQKFDTGSMALTQLRSFTTSDDRNLALTQIPNTSNIYILEQRTESTSRIYEYDVAIGNFSEVQNQSQISSGSNGLLNLDAAMVNDTITLYSYDGENQLFESKDKGESWQYLSTLPITPWSVALFVSHSDPSQMIVGGVNAYRSNNGGKNWQIINEWWEYYGQEATKLHADMMYFEEYMDENDEPFILINHHGGISLSRNYGKNNNNISLYGLNTAQYYDVSTYPADPDWVFAGSQDQGIQRGILGENDNISDFHQIVSGDYGHTVFTMNGENMYTMYPGGAVSFYENPLSSGPSGGYSIESMNESSAWIPPMIEDPAADSDIAYAAGGSADGGSGSYLIKLDNQAGSITAENMPFNFVEYGTITAIGISAVNNDYWYVGTDMGRFLYSTDRGQSFTMSNDFLTSGHYLYGAGITPSKIDPEVVYYAGSGYNGPGVYKSTDHGQNFEPMGDGLPDALIHNVALNADESLIYAATSAGPYVYIVADGLWYSLHGSSTPNQTYWSVEYVPHLDIARFGTYGRGIWDFKPSSDPSSTQDQNISNDLHVYPNPVQDVLNIDMEEAGSYIAQITDISGKNWIQKEVQSDGQSISMDAQSLPSGQYIIRLQNKEKLYITKFIKI